MASFHHLPYEQKRLNPQPHSCARCLNRPIDFCTSNDRVNTIPWTWKKGVTQAEIFDAMMSDVAAVEGTDGKEDSLKDFNPCPMGGWSRAAPFYERECESGKW